MRGNYSLTLPDDRLRSTCLETIKFINNLVFPDWELGDLYNSRLTGWLIIDDFEIYAESSQAAQHIIAKNLSGYKEGKYDFSHLPHCFTDLIWLLNASEHSKQDLPDNFESLDKMKRKYALADHDMYKVFANKEENILYFLWTKEGIKYLTHLKAPESKLYIESLRPFVLYRLRKVFSTKSGNKRRKCLFNRNSIKIFLKNESFIMAYKKQFTFEEN